MTFLESVKTCFRKYAVIKGRASRSEFWWFNLFVLIICIVFEYGLGMTNTIIKIVYIVISLILFLPCCTVLFRRLHDMNRSAWWCLIAFIPFIGIIALIIWLCFKGTNGTNRFGDDPLESKV